MENPEKLTLLFISASRFLIDLISGIATSTGAFRLLEAVDLAAFSMDGFLSMGAGALLLDADIGPKNLCRLSLAIAERLPAMPLLSVGLVHPKEIMQFIESGGWTNLSLDADVASFTAHLKNAAKGLPVCTMELISRAAHRLLSRSPAGHPDRDPSCPVMLTEREKQILRLIAKGLLDKQIASRLGVCLSTVKNHNHRILAKLKATRRREAIRIAYKTGVLTGPLTWSLAPQPQEV